MNTHHLSLFFRVEKDDTLATMESVFATARRGNVSLTGLQMRNPATDDEIRLDLCASEPEWLDLFVARLRNIIGVHDCTPIPAWQAQAA